MADEIRAQDEQNLTQNSWRSLRRFTDARIGLGRVGSSISTRELLAFQMDHANAQDAVHIPLDEQKLLTELPSEYGQFVLHSQAKDRAMYLQRPDLGRRLAEESVERLRAYKSENSQDLSVAIVVADGLSSTAVQSHAAQMVKMLCERIHDSLAPICVVQQGRVAIGDEIGELLKVDCLVLLVGERPGLSSPDSLGIYYTFQPKIGLQDANPPGRIFDIQFRLASCKPILGPNV